MNLWHWTGNHLPQTGVDVTRMVVRLTPQDKKNLKATSSLTSCVLAEPSPTVEEQDRHNDVAKGDQVLIVGKKIGWWNSSIGRGAVLDSHC
jgi:hypothetical protein